MAYPDNALETPNWFDGPMTFYAVVDSRGEAFGFGSRRAAGELMERFETSLARFGPYRIIKLVEVERENA